MFLEADDIPFSDSLNLYLQREFPPSLERSDTFNTSFSLLGVAHPDVADRAVEWEVDENVEELYIGVRAFDCADVCTSFLEDGKIPFTIGVRYIIPVRSQSAVYAR